MTAFGRATLPPNRKADATAIIVARVVEHGARRAHLGEHELGRLSAAGLRHVHQPTVALDDSPDSIKSTTTDCR